MIKNNYPNEKKKMCKEKKYHEKNHTFYLKIKPQASKIECL